MDTERIELGNGVWYDVKRELSWADEQWIDRENMRRLAEQAREFGDLFRIVQDQRSTVDELAAAREAQGEEPFDEDQAWLTLQRAVVGASYGKVDLENRPAREVRELMRQAMPLYREPSKDEDLEGKGRSGKPWHTLAPEDQYPIVSPTS